MYVHCPPFSPCHPLLIPAQVRPGLIVAVYIPIYIPKLDCLCSLYQHIHSPPFLPPAILCWSLHSCRTCLASWLLARARDSLLAPAFTTRLSAFSLTVSTSSQAICWLGPPEEERSGKMVRPLCGRGGGKA